MRTKKQIEQWPNSGPKRRNNKGTEKAGKDRAKWRNVIGGQYDDVAASVNCVRDFHIFLQKEEV